MPIVEPAMLRPALPPGSRLLGFDVGEKTIGLAVSDPGLAVASPLVTLRPAAGARSSISWPPPISCRACSIAWPGLRRRLDRPAALRRQCRRRPQESFMPGPLDGLRVFDLTRILAGPTCTQLLGDLGAEVIKIERPGAGDDTRKWGPPYVKDAAGDDTSESAYYLSSNRNKRSVAIDIAKPAGQRLARRLIAASDVMVENFKVGDMARYGLSYDDLKGELPRLIYCSISGFGQTGPYAPRAGYDL